MISNAAELALHVCSLIEQHSLSKKKTNAILSTFVKFFVDFCLHVHRPREDNVLFPWLAQFQEQSIQDMLHVLEKDHAYADTILQSLLTDTTGSQDAHDRAAKQLSRYALYLIQHTSREEDLLFPIVRICAKNRGDFPAIAAVKDSDTAIEEWGKTFEQLKSSLRD